MDSVSFEIQCLWLVRCMDGWIEGWMGSVS